MKCVRGCSRQVTGVSAFLYDADDGRLRLKWKVEHRLGQGQTRPRSKRLGGSPTGPGSSRLGNCSERVHVPLPFVLPRWPPCVKREGWQSWLVGLAEIVANAT